MNFKLKSIKEVPGPMRQDGGTFEIVAEIVRDGVTKEVTWYYSPGYKGHEERMDTNEPENPEDFPLRNPIGFLLAGLMFSLDEAIVATLSLQGLEGGYTLNGAKKVFKKMEDLL